LPGLEQVNSITLPPGIKDTALNAAALMGKYA
jgi:hypothetical protein